jgi:hypothetical protein
MFMLTDEESYPDPSRKPLVIAGTVLSVTGLAVFIASACAMLFMWVALMIELMGWLGAILGILTAPIAVAYPLLHWMVRGAVPPMILAVWAAGVIGALVSMWWASSGRQRFARGPFEQTAPTADEHAVKPLASEEAGD